MDDNTENYSPKELKLKIQEAETTQAQVHLIAQALRDMGWTDDTLLIQNAKDIWWDCQLNKEKYQNMYNELLAEQEANYPVATKIWNYLRDTLGYNEYISAGIMGNIMGEVGGGTLHLKENLYYKDLYYGICQWSTGYIEVWGQDLDYQLNFLKDTIKYEFDTFGFKYQNNFDYNTFLEMTNVKEAALAFAKCYERCAAYTYEARLKNAEKAYAYYVGD